MSKPYQWRGTVPLKPDDHEFWQLVQKRVAQKWPWEQIAVEIGCHVDDLIHWVNWVYQPPKRPKVAVVDPRPFARSKQNYEPVARQSAQFLAWKRARDGAKATREAAER